MPTVQIKLASVDITDRVVFSTARFMSQVNGQGGEAHLRVRDLDRSLSPVPGALLELLVDGDPVWTGYALTPKRVFVFPALNVTDFGLARFFDLEAVDINVLFTRRIVFKQSAPEEVLAPLYGAHTADTTAITELFANWIDLSGDGIDTSSGVVGVGDINEDQAARPWEGSDTWGQAMQSISALPASIYYLRPNKVFAYVDNDTPDAPFGLSDQPSAGGGGTTTTTDDFNRTVAGSWGTGPLGTWSTNGNAGDVTPSVATLVGNLIETVPIPSPNTTGEFRVKFKFPGDWSTTPQITLDFGDGYPPSALVELFFDPTTGDLSLYQDGPGFSDVTISTFSPDDVVWAAIRLDADGTASAKIWLASGSEPGWQITFASTHVITDFSVVNFYGTGSFPTSDWETYEASFTTDGGGGATTKGYRECEILLDGTNLANDVLGWGAGYGSNVPVFDRDEDATSISTHGRWQLGQTTFGVYKQATIDRIVDSIINGSPENHRGQKDDRTAITLVTYEPGLLPAQKVDFTSNVFGFSDVIPIRKMEVTFEAPDNPRYALTLSHEIDAPWSFFDLFRYHLPPLPGIPPFKWPPQPQPTSTGPCLCGMTDEFNRTETGSLGTSDFGGVWDTSTYGSAEWSVAAGVATVAVPASGFRLGLLNIKATTTTTITASGQITVSGAPSSSAYWFLASDSSPDFAELDFATDGTVSLLTGAGTDTTTLAFGATSPFKVRISSDGTTARARVWLASDPEPNTWDVTQAFSTPAPLNVDIYMGVSADASATTGTFAVLNANNVNRCAGSQFDDFQRTDGGPTSWGTASGGAVWTNTAGANFAASVGGGFGKLDNAGSGATASDATMEVTPLPFAAGANFSVEVQFRVSSDTDVLSAEFRFDGVSFEWSVDSGGTNLPQLVLNDNQGNRVVVAFQTDFWGTMGSESVGIFKVERSAGNARLKLWDSSLAEPDWQLSAASVYGATSSLVGFVTSTPDLVGPQHVWVANIDFGYAGKPCYPCTDSIAIDNFERTNPTAWGVAVPDGHTWTMATSGVGSVTYSVDGSHAGIHLPSISDGPGQGSLPIGLQSSGIDWVFLDCSFTSDGRIQIDTHQSVPDPTITVRSLSGRLDLYIENNTGTVNTNLDLLNNHFNFRLVIPADKSRADGYLWLVGSPVPVVPTLSIPAVTPGTDNNIDKIIVTGSSESGSTFPMDIKIGEIDSGLCANQPITLPSGPTFGPYTELALRSDAITYQLTRAVQPGTLNLSVGSPGKVLVPGVDYNVNNTTGVVTLTNAITDPTTPVTAMYTAAGPLPTPAPTGAIAQFPGTGPNTQAAFISLCNNTAYGIIEMAAGTYFWSGVAMRINRTAANPLYVRPASGAAVTFDGTGGISGVGFLYLGSNRGSGFPAFVTDYITFDPSGTGGSFTIQNYHIEKTGLILTGWCDHVILNGFNIVNCSGMGGSFSHCLYINSDNSDVPFNAGHHSTNITANNWVIVGDAGRTLNAMQTFHNPNVIGLSMDNWDVQLVNRWAFLYGDASGISLTNWNGQNCNETIDSPTITGSDHATGTVSGCNGNGSCNTLAQGSGPWINSGIVDGGGNTP